ncbi:MAG TPA: HlyC/CorC family transporter [Gammaproteobacteria bacterium]|nr:HlyC/CorC family transporter [Gammaproteobacteria bacterium]
MMDNIPLELLFACLALLIFLSAFFSASETAMMSINRYRLRHLVKTGQAGPKRVAKLLERPDRLIGIILLGNNFVNILASSLATIIALRLMGEAGIAIAAGLLTLIVLIFAEVGPKTLAILHPERIAFPASIVLVPLLKLFYPIIWVINTIANSMLAIIGVSPKKAGNQNLSTEELRAVVNEAGALIPAKHQKMLLNILDLEKVTVEDIIVSRNDIVGIDLNEEIDEIIDVITNSQHTRLLVYRGNIDHVMGVMHVRDALPLLHRKELNIDSIIEISKEPYFIPKGTPLNVQQLNFQRQKRRIALVVDEYGEIFGLVTLEDILEEIVGEFTTDASESGREIHPQKDGSYIVDGSINIRTLNRSMQINLPTKGPKTLSGLIIEQLESIPGPGTSLLIDRYPIEILQTKDNAIKSARVFPALEMKSKKQ